MKIDSNENTYKKKKKKQQKSRHTTHPSALPLQHTLIPHLLQHMHALLTGWAKAK